MVPERDHGRVRAPYDGGMRDEAPQLITYPDRLVPGIRALTDLMDGPLRAFGGVHVLPFYVPIDGADAGFDPTDHTRVDPRVGTWEDVAALAAHRTVMADMIVNHVSADSAQFRDVLERGEDSPHAPMFLTYSSVFPDGATEQELAAIFRPRPGLPFTHYRWGDTTRLVWTTFTPRQIDLDLTTRAGSDYLDQVLGALASGGVTQVRLDAVGYAAKRAGTSCFMTEDTYAFIDELTQRARERGMEVLVEIHSHHRTQVQVATRVDRVYDFALPPLLLHALLAGDAQPLLRWIGMRPTNAVTVLDTHDGIGVVDVGRDGATGEEGLLTDAQVDELVEAVHEASGGQSRQATGWAASNVDVYQVNCTYLDALGGDEDAYMLARTVQVLLPGTAQIYYVGLMGAHNDMDLLARTGVGRDINRHHFTADEVGAALADPTSLANRQLELVRLRATHPAFDGTFRVEAATEGAGAAPGADGRFALVWEDEARGASVRADVDVRARRVDVTAS